MAPHSLCDSPKFQEPGTIPFSSTKSGVQSNGVHYAPEPKHLAKYSNPALYVTPQHGLELRQTEIPTPAPSEVLLHVRCTGICGSDMHLWHSGSIGPLIVDRPCILGHEPSGIVLSVGCQVTNLRPGDRVAIEPGVPCGKCFLCTSGNYNLCEAVEFAGVCPHAGTIRRFVAHDARYCHKIPESMSFTRGALVEPLAVVLHAISLCNGALAIGRPALICGAGPIGLIALAVAKASGAWPLVITDVDSGRLEFAKAFVQGVSTFQIDPTASSSQVADAIRHTFGQEEETAPSIVLECTGVESSIITGVRCCRRSGTVMVIGVGLETMNNLPFMHISLAEINLRFTNRYTRVDWVAGINALANNNVLNLDKLVTHTFPLEQALEAMQTCTDRSSKSIKVQIVDDTVIEL